MALAPMSGCHRAADPIFFFPGPAASAAAANSAKKGLTRQLYNGGVKKGYFGPYGGRFVPETLIEPLRRLEAAYERARRDKGFREEVAAELRDFVGRPTAVTYAGNLSEELGLKLYLKRE